MSTLADFLANLTKDETFTSGGNYARSIAGGQNVPNMISTGTSYSSGNPQGFTQQDITSGRVPNPFEQPDIAKDVNIPPPFQGTYYKDGMETGILVPPSERSVTIFDDTYGKKKMPPLRDIFGGNPKESTLPIPDFRYNDNIDIDAISKKLLESGINFPNIPGPMQGPVDMPMPPISEKRNDQIFIDDMTNFIDDDSFIPRKLIQGPVDMNTGVEFIPEIPETFIDMIPSNRQPGLDIANTFTPQETAKFSSQEELLNLISNKNELSQMPADDGVRNQYQVELDEFINKSPINMDTYKEELPIGSAINLGIPAFMEAAIPMAVPGLGLAKNISNSFQNDFSPSPSPSASPAPTSSFNPGIDYSNIYKFGR